MATSTITVARVDEFRSDLLKLGNLIRDYSEDAEQKFNQITTNNALNEDKINDAMTNIKNKAYALRSQWEVMENDLLNQLTSLAEQVQAEQDRVASQLNSNG